MNNNYEVYTKTQVNELLTTRIPQIGFIFDWYDHYNKKRLTKYVVIVRYVNNKYHVFWTFVSSDKNSWKPIPCLPQGSKTFTSRDKVYELIADIMDSVNQRGAYNKASLLQRLEINDVYIHTWNYCRENKDKPIDDFTINFNDIDDKSNEFDNIQD